MHSTKTYSIDKVISFIPINDNLVNFKTTFTLMSNGPFYMYIVDQHKLDTTPHENLEFKYIDRTISGDIVYDKNIQNSYYLLLKSDIPTSIEVELNTEGIQAKTTDINTSNNYLYILVIIVVIGIGYYMFTKNSSGGIRAPQAQGKLSRSLLERLQSTHV